MSTTWIMLVNWNGAVDTIACLESLMLLDDQDFAVAIVDNGSADDSCVRIADWAQNAAGGGFRRIRSDDLAHDPAAKVWLIESDRNLGFAGANNLAMRLAQNDPDAHYFWILNNDTVVAPDSLSIQRARMARDPAIGMLGARLMFHDAPDRVQGLAGGFHYGRARGYHLGLGERADRLPTEADVERAMTYVLGASMFVRRTAVEQCGDMSEAYFLYYEEIDWAERMKDAGRFRLAVAQDAVVWHKEGGTIGSATKGRPSDTSLYYLQASLLRFYRRRHPWLLPVAWARVAREMAGLAARRDWSGVKVIALAISDVLSGRLRQGRYASAEFQD